MLTFHPSRSTTVTRAGKAQIVIVAIVVILLLIAAAWFLLRPKPDYVLKGEAINKNKWPEVIAQSDTWKCYLEIRQAAPNPSRPFMILELKTEKKVDGLYQHVDYDLRALTPKNETLTASGKMPVRAKFIDQFRDKIIDKMVAELLVKAARKEATIPVKQISAHLKQAKSIADVTCYLQALKEIGEASLPACATVRNFLSPAQKEETRLLALQAILAMMPKKEQATKLNPILEQVLTTKPSNNLLSCVFAAIIARQDAAVPALSNALPKVTPAVQQQILQKIIQLGPHAQQAAPALKTLLASQAEPKIRVLAAHAAGSLAAPIPELLAILRQLGQKKSAAPDALRLAARNAWMAENLPGSNWDMSCWTRVEMDSGGFGMQGNHSLVKGSQKSYRLLFQKNGILKWNKKGEPTPHTNHWTFDGTLHFKLADLNWKGPISGYKKLSGDGPTDGWHHTYWSATRIQ